MKSSEQNYKNHAKYYTAHHFIFYPLLFLFLCADAYCIYRFHGTRMKAIFGFIDILILFVGWESFMLRQHYALGNQNRIVRLEMRVRYYQLTQRRFENIEEQLSFGQIAALRFASDGELLGLIDKTIKENLSPKTIKQSIQNWNPDDMRV